MKIRECFELDPPKNTNKYNDFVNYIDTSSVNDGVLSNVQYLESDYPSRANKMVKSDDIIYSTVRPLLRHYYYYDDCISHAIVSTGFCVMRNKNTKVLNTIFAYYFLRSSEVITYLNNVAENSQATFPTFSKKDLGKIDLPDFNYEKQCRIAIILSAYDKLIEKNNRKIAILQAQAQELYKEWFVRFRFPGHKTAKFENGLPSGWKICKLGDYANILMGQSPESCYYNSNNEGLPFHQGVGSYGEWYLQDDIYSTEGKRIAEPNSIIFSVRAPVGRLNITINRIILGRGVAGINAKDNHNGFLFWQLKTTYAQEDLIGNGSIFASVTKDELFNQKLVIPNDSLLCTYDSTAYQIERQIRLLYLINKSLTQQRDLLLPRLMSGKLEV